MPRPRRPPRWSWRTHRGGQRPHLAAPPAMTPPQPLQPPPPPTQPPRSSHQQPGRAQSRRPTSSSRPNRRRRRHPRLCHHPSLATRLAVVRRRWRRRHHPLTRRPTTPCRQCQRPRPQHGATARPAAAVATVAAGRDHHQHGKRTFGGGWWQRPGVLFFFVWFCLSFGCGQRRRWRCAWCGLPPSSSWDRGRGGDGGRPRVAAASPPDRHGLAAKADDAAAGAQDVSTLNFSRSR